MGDYGKLLGTQEESHQYKFCLANASIIIKAKSEGEVPVQPEVIFYNGFSIVLEPAYKYQNYKFKKSSGGGKYHTKSINQLSKIKNIFSKCFTF